MGLFIFRSNSGFAYSIEFCTGQENNSEFKKTLKLDLGASANVVVHFARVIQVNQHHKLLFDNYYTTSPHIV